jgi:hypothetical protein
VVEEGAAAVVPRVPPESPLQETTQGTYSRRNMFSHVMELGKALLMSSSERMIVVSEEAIHQ